jgi:hypothetical protein
LLAGCGIAVPVQPHLNTGWLAAPGWRISTRDIPAGISGNMPQYIVFII